MKAFTKFLLLGTLLIFAIKAWAQDSGRISAEFDNARAADVFSQLGAQSGLRFFYDPAHVDRITISAKFQQQPLKTVLPQILANTGLFYLIDDTRKSVFITRDYPITSWRNIDTKGVISSPNSITQPYFTDEADTKTPLASIENKLYEIGLKANKSSGGKLTLSGNVFSKQTGKPLAGVQVYVESLRAGSTTDQYGYYSLSLPTGRHTLLLRGMGLADTRRQIYLSADGRFNIEVEARVTSLKEVVLTAEKTANINRTAMGVERLDIKTIK